ncbi:MAG: hypothetical protein K9K66_06570 [Desulfarculaceae bacterium]|nr:hypothetical protein [Desulfarculaceae bacterium]MCF8071752.1 hypothetical protein [Desulfarculaceae bacterium]MCF8101302.1 hypothetical protein [Desulfarculaceae bacterium]MCF8117261.1 hypothetical protein [Desulfarculaceae bacterium]
MLGIASPELALAYILCIAASVLCIIYGIIKWNDSGPLTEELRDLDQWAPGPQDD